ncbi:MAG: YfcE family phosphodiesterase [Erysipelotrichaceae bacterium]|nr:YfcE family phosphodiesterase [Erysipelotrichaceae bacterium]MBR0474709.1 YfcE family phosphodiesterase [Erysipelotrichaceae bacterium]
MKIVVMSDSHGHNENIQDVLEKEPHANGYLHCGDVCSSTRYFPDVIFVSGNCDYDPDLPKFAVVDFGKLKIYMTHGDRIYDRDKTLAKWAKEKGCQIVVHGHTHCQTDITVDGIRILNPGSLSVNRDGTPLGYIVIETDGTDNYTVTRKYLNIQ